MSIAVYEMKYYDIDVDKIKQLLLYGMQRIREKNNEPITLHVADWNKKAVELYKNVGFVITKTEVI